MPIMFCNVQMQNINFILPIFGTLDIFHYRICIFRVIHRGDSQTDLLQDIRDIVISTWIKNTVTRHTTSYYIFI